MPKGKRVNSCGGQSIVELVVVLALVAIVVTAVVTGIGQQSVDRMQHVHDAFAESGAKPGQATPGARGGGGWSSSGGDAIPLERKPTAEITE